MFRDPVKGHKGDPKVATIPERIRGAISMALTITCMSVSCNATDQRWQIVFLIAGMLYFLTTIAIVFDRMD
jgi:hypothetical protein